MKRILLYFATFFVPIICLAQVGIGTTTPEASSMLDIDATDKGVLVPRVSLTDVTNTSSPVASPATGLLVWNTNTTVTGGNGVGFYFYNGSQWMPIQQSAVDDDRINNLADGKSDMDGSDDGSSIFLGIDAGANDDSSNNRNLGIGYQALNANTTGVLNIALGYHALLNNDGGNGNIAMGYQSLLNTTSPAFSNIGIGSYSLQDNVSGQANISLGANSLLRNTSGSSNVAIGDAAGTNVQGDNNTFIGRYSGQGSVTHSKSGSVFLGYSSGRFETSSNRLYVENTSANANNALIYGEFGADATTAGNILRTNSQFQIGNPTGTGYAFPAVDGTANQILQTDGSGSLSWSDPNTGDSDWYLENTTNSASNINDDIYTLGNVAIGKNTANWPLDVENTTLGRGIASNLAGTHNSNAYGFFADITNSGDGDHFGSYINVNGAGTGAHYGDRIWLSGTGTGNQTGNYIDISNAGNSTHYGEIFYLRGNGSGAHIGSEINLSGAGTGSQTGTVNNITNTGNADHYGIRNSLSGNGTGNHYGINNFLSGSGSGIHYGTRNQISGTGTGIQYGIRNDIFNSGNSDHFGTYNSIDNSGSGNHYGTYNRLQGNSTGQQFGVYTTMNSTSDLAQYGKYTLFSNSGNGNQYGDYNNMGGSGSGDTYGTFNAIASSGGGDKYGSYQNFSGNNSSAQYGTYHRFQGTGGVTHGLYNSFEDSGNANRFGVFNRMTSSGSGSIYGNYTTISGAGAGTKIGNYVSILSGVGGTHYGVYSDVTKSGSFAGYFIGRVSIGTTGTNNYLLPAARGTANQVMQTDGSGNVSWATLNTTITANNGLSASGNNVSMGGTLTQNTTITHNNFSLTHNLNSSGDFIIQDLGLNHFEVRDNGNTYLGGDTYWFDETTSGTLLASLTDLGDDGVFTVYNDGAIQHYMPAAGNTTFNEQGLATNFAIESDTEPYLFYVRGNLDRIGIMTTVPTHDLTIKQSNTTQASAGGLGLESASSTANWKVYHSGSHLSFAENGVRRAYVEAGTGNYVITSDKRLKKSISSMEKVLPKVNNLDIFTYLYKDQQNGSSRSAGFMAQEVKAIFPDAVKMNEEGFYGINYDYFTVVAVKAIQEQQKTIEAQEKRLEILENELGVIKAMLKK